MPDLATPSVMQTIAEERRLHIRHMLEATVLPNPSCTILTKAIRIHTALPHTKGMPGHKEAIHIHMATHAHQHISSGADTRHHSR